jgi:acyl carrier protein
MIPARFVLIEAAPISHNGKIDLSRLPPPNVRSDNSMVTPLTEIEQLLAQIWQAVLKVQSIGVHDNFFELGGHSLLAVQILMRVREAFQTEVELSAIFNAPTIATLAEVIEKSIGCKTSDLPPIVRAPRESRLPLSMNQENLWRIERTLPGTHFFNMPYVYCISGNLNVALLQQTLELIIKRHDALRTIFDEVEGSPAQIVKEPREFNLCHIDLRGKSPEEISSEAAGVILQEREGPFDLKSGPLVRFKLLQLTAEDHLFLVTLHHIIGDQWSVGIFSDELTQIYGALAEGTLLPPEPSIQFADYACWERRLLKTGWLDAQLTFWKKQLSDAPSQATTLRSNNSAGGLSFGSSCQPLEFGDLSLSAIRDLAFRESCTPFMILVSALSIVLYAQSGQEDIRIGTLVANRNRKETTRTIGHMVNTVVLRTNVNSRMTVKQLIARVREIALSAYANQELPFEYLQDALQRQLDERRESLINVLLMYRYSTILPVLSCGLNFAPFDLQPETGPEALLTTHDLVFQIREMQTMLTGTVNLRVDRLGSTYSSCITKSLGQVLSGITCADRDLMNNSIGFLTSTVLQEVVS